MLIAMGAASLVVVAAVIGTAARAHRTLEPRTIGSAAYT